MLGLGLCEYGKCPKISYTKVSDKMACANSVDPDQTAPEGAVWSGFTLLAILLSILKAPYPSKNIHFIIQKKGLINWYTVLIQS